LNAASTCDVILLRIHHHQQQQQQQQQRHHQVCVQLPTPADNATLLAFAAERRAAAAPGGRRDRSISPARRAHSSKPADDHGNAILNGDRNPTGISREWE